MSRNAITYAIMRITSIPIITNNIGMRSPMIHPKNLLKMLKNDDMEHGKEKYEGEGSIGRIGEQPNKR
jgi:hypothetical protein